MGMPTPECKSEPREVRASDSLSLSAAACAGAQPEGEASARAAESGGPSGPEPTRFGDWEKNGRCIDF
jgi:hypothetical protein